LADDLRRFLEDKPIRARRPSWLGQGRRWARRHRAAVWSAAVTLLVTLAVLAGSVGWVVRDRAARQAKTATAVQAALEEAQRFLGEGKWPQGQAAARRAEALLQDGAAEPALAGQVQGLLRELALEEADSRLVARLEGVRLLQTEVNVQENRFVLERAIPEYRQAFKEYGIGVGTMAPAEAAALLRRRPPSVRGTLMAALDHWLILARYHKAPEADWLERVLSAADTDAWRQGVRAARARNDRQALEQLACQVDVAAQPPEALFVLELGLRQRGAQVAAVTLLRRAQAAFPGDFWINHSLGAALRGCQPPRLEEAIRFLTVAVALRPQSAGARLNLGSALLATGRVDEAIAALGKAVELNRCYAAAHYQLGNALARNRKLEDAIAAFRRTIALQPEHAEAYCHLGHVLQLQGEFARALAAMERGHELGSRRNDWPYPSARWVTAGRRLVELDGRLPAVLRAGAEPANAAERIEYARLCFCKRYYVVAARFWADAFAVDPQLAADPRDGHGKDAACAAALAAAGRGKDAGRLNDQERRHWRKQARQWLRAELAAFGKRLESAGPKDRQLVQRRLRQWQRDRDLAGLRDAAAVARLPAEEREACEQLWAEVEALLGRADPAR
jgi:tetratricopeptide (TPR) repeat protein